MLKLKRKLVKFQAKIKLITYCEFTQQSKMQAAEFDISTHVHVLFIVLIFCGTTTVPKIANTFPLKTINENLERNSH